eukprot:TRINITY_DN11313_c0_g1_i8.p1 TRINITY_DN11313_c0_g1~~TRINITY_DN11313_c0_g1_i8.p1  ORF type:complete len:364 (-),score=66.85 TRINITY_DN11313_c0_g1_i8:65-1156(-)
MNKPKQEDLLVKYKNYTEQLAGIVKVKDRELEDLNYLNLEEKICRVNEYDQELENYICSAKIKESDWKTITNEAVSGVANNLEITESVVDMELQAVQVETNIGEDGTIIKTWEVLVNPSESMPHVEVKTRFKTLELAEKKERVANKLPTSICNVKIDVKGLESSREIEEAIQYCEEENDPQDFHIMLDEYLELYQQRKEMITKALKSDNITLKMHNILEFCSDEGRHLLYLILNIQFDEGYREWKEAWSCKFSEAGLAAAESCNLPQSLIQDGYCEDWSSDYCIKTLAKLASLQEEPADPSMIGHFKTPQAGKRNKLHSTPLNGADNSNMQSSNDEETFNAETPLNSQQSQRPPKRRLNSQKF